MIRISSGRFMLMKRLIERYSKPSVYLSAKCMSSSTENVVKSSYPNIEISNLSLSNYLLENVKDHADKPAVVSVVFIRIYILLFCACNEACSKDDFHSLICIQQCYLHFSNLYFDLLCWKILFELVVVHMTSQCLILFFLLMPMPMYVYLLLLLSYYFYKQFD